MKKLLVVLLSVMLVLSLAACGGGSVSGETYDTGNISVLVPDGWQPYQMSDMFDEYEGDMNPENLTLYKTTEEFFGLSEPSIMIAYFDPNTTWVSPEFVYNDPVAREEIVIGNYTWNGFDATTEDLFSGETLPLHILYAQQDGYTVQVSLFPVASEGQFSFDDADVQAILASIAINPVDLTL